MRNSSYLSAVDVLVSKCHELMIDAREQAADGGDAALQHDLDVLGKQIMSKLESVRGRIKKKRRAA